MNYRIEKGYVHAFVKSKLNGSCITFPKISVGATENAILAATLANGKTTLKNCAIEPEIKKDLTNFLNKAGASIRWIGKRTVEINGVKKLKKISYSVMGDRIECGTFCVAAAISQGNLKIKGFDPKLINTELNLLKKVGAKIKIEQNLISIIGPKKIKNIKFIKTREYDGFPTDLQAQFMSLLCKATGKSIISDKTLSIGTTGQKELHFGTNGTKWVKITESGFLDFQKLSINGQQGTAGQYIRNTGNGGIEWATLDSRNSFGKITVGGTSLNSGSVGDTFTIAGGSNITLTPDSSNNTLTIAATQPNVFQNVAVSGQSTISADASADTFNFVAGTGIQITTDASTDTMTITNTVTAAQAADAVFKTLAVSGQSNVIASSATDTLSLAAGDGISISTNDSSKEINYRVDALPRLSKEGVLSFTNADGTTNQLPLRNFFINQSTSLPVNGGGSQVGQSTRALRMLKSDGSTFKFMVMPANSAGDGLVFTYTKADGNTVTKDITMVA